jgi:hypothetical protein
MLIIVMKVILDGEEKSNPWRSWEAEDWVRGHKALVSLPNLPEDGLHKNRKPHSAAPYTKLK